LKNVLFDLDGTLTDPLVGITRCLAHAVGLLGVVPPPAREMAPHIGPPIRETIASLLGDRSSDENVSLALSHYRDRYQSVGMYENEPYSGIKEMLDRLSSTGMNLFVATSKPHVFARPILEHFALAGYFTRIFGSELSGQNDDKGALLQHLLTDTGIDPRDTVMVGDRHYDVVAALAQKILPIGVTYGYGSRAELVAAGAAALCDSPPEVAEFLSTVEDDRAGNGQ
jgi:phosphoglycolate phosphatase